jgi:hypothetical protein
MKLKQAISWGVGIVVILTIGVYAEFVRETRQRDPAFLLSCADVDTPIASWTCRQVLLHEEFSPDQVKELNRAGAATFPVWGSKPKSTKFSESQ